MLVNFGAGSAYVYDTGPVPMAPVPSAPASATAYVAPKPTAAAPTPSAGPDLTAIQTQLNAAITGSTAAQQAATQATSAARIANVPSALGYAATATTLASQAQAVLLTARAEAAKRNLQGTTIAAGQIATLAAQARGQADLANQVANTAMRSGTADPFAVAAAAETAAEVVSGVARALTPGGAMLPSRAGGGSGPRYVESGEEMDVEATAAPTALPPAPAPAPTSPTLVYAAIAAVAYFWARG